MEDLCLIDVAKSWIYNKRKRGRDKWSPRKKSAIMRVFPIFYSIPAWDLEKWIDFCFLEVLLYKHFCDIHIDIGNNDKSIVETWDNFRYNAWHLERREDSNSIENESNSKSQDNDNAQDTIIENEWEIYLDFTMLKLCKLLK